MLKTETSLETSLEMSLETSLETSSRSSQMSRNDNSRAKTIHRPTPSAAPREMGEKVLLAGLGLLRQKGPWCGALCAKPPVRSMQ